jgi:hypothetical protein
MFIWINKQGVQSDRGFVVQFTGRFAAEYREGVSVVTLAVEDGVSGGLPAIIVSSEAFRRWDNDRAVIDPDKQERMLCNLREAAEFQGLKLLVE